MPAPAVVRKTANQGLKLAAALAFLAPLLTRISVGWAFFLTGRGKLADLDTFTQFLTDLGVPFPALNAPFVAGLEFVGGFCLVLGLLTRLMSAALAGSMVVALMHEKGFLESWGPTGEMGPLDFDPFVFIVLLTWLVLYGPGPVSADKPLAKWLGVGGGASAEGSSK